MTYKSAYTFSFLSFNLGLSFNILHQGTVNLKEMKQVNLKNENGVLNKKEIRNIDFVKVYLNP